MDMNGRRKINSDIIKNKHDYEGMGPQSRTNNRINSNN